MRKKENKRIALVGNYTGILRLMRHVPRENIKCIIVSSIRPAHISKVKTHTMNLGAAFLIQPKFQSPEYGSFLEEFRKAAIDLILCDSYSMILREDLLESVHFNAINIHASLLPNNRGCNPIQWSIIHNDSETGVSIHYMDKDLDTGDLIAQKSIPIQVDDTWFTLTHKLEEIGEELIAETLPLILKGENKRTSQPKNGRVMNKRLTPNSPKIVFDRMSDFEIYNLIRAQVSPLKGAYIDLPSGQLRFENAISLEEVAGLRKKYGMDPFSILQEKQD